MDLSRVKVDAGLLEQARGLAAGRTGREVVEYALRRLIASKRQEGVVDAIAELEGLPAELGAPVQRQQH